MCATLMLRASQNEEMQDENGLYFELLSLPEHDLGVHVVTLCLWCAAGAGAALD